uniref:Protein kinase domain-containing protein n=1 Tax=Acrobeloides nanus TaxID=290746 RepID=A0A914CMI3_9BILA
MNSGVIEIGERLYINIRLDDLQDMGSVGFGSFGNVSRRRLNNHLIAVKWLPITDDEEEVRRVNMDLDVIRRSNDCEYIVKFHGYLITYGNLYICMELMATCLEKLIKRLNTGFPIAVIGKIAVSVIKGERKKYSVPYKVTKMALFS